jgi:hypothetical protein
MVHLFTLAKVFIDLPPAEIEELLESSVHEARAEVGKKDQQALLAFLDDHSAAMLRIMLRYATERLEPAMRSHYVGAR